MRNVQRALCDFLVKLLEPLYIARLRYLEDEDLAINGKHGHRLSPGTLYPLLARMEQNGWLRSRGGGSSKERKPYRVTAAGRRLLSQLQREVEELHRELVLDEEPQHAGR